MFWDFLKQIIPATILTGVVGLSLKFLIEKIFMKDIPHAEIELLFGNLKVISAALALVGVLILFEGIATMRNRRLLGVFAQTA